jgi:hypothetical protein
MNSWIFKPHSYGELGNNTQFTETGELVLLEYVIQHPLIDNVIGVAVIGNYLITEELLRFFTESRISGFQICQAQVGISEQFPLAYGNGYVTPKLQWLKVTGRPFEQDFGIYKGTTVVSDAVRQVVLSFPYRFVTFLEFDSYEFDLPIEERKKRFLEQARRQRDQKFGKRPKS